MEKNQTVELDITALGSDGQGLGRYEGFVVFVPFSLPGERVRALIVKVTAAYAVGKLLEVLQSSPGRISPRCAVFGRCGGCALQHLEYGEQLAFKRQAVADALRKIGSIQEPNVLPVIGMDDPWGYRNKGTFPVGAGPNGLAAGMYAQRSHRIIDVASCPIQPDAVNTAVAAVRRWAVQNGIPPYDELTGKGLLRAVMVRSFQETGESLVAVVVNGETLPAAAALVQELRSALPGIKGVVQNINTENTNVVLGRRDKLLWGNPTAMTKLGGLTYGVGAASFFQVNTEQMVKLYSAAAEAAALTGTETVVDAYCGVGTIGQFMATRAGKIVGIESVAESVREAKSSAARNGIHNAEYILGRAEDVLADKADELKPDVILMDPPRKGCDAKFLEAAAASGAQRLVYVSCNPATLARDVKILLEKGYELKKVQPVDMFPQTADVECVALLTTS